MVNMVEDDPEDFIYEEYWVHYRKLRGFDTSESGLYDSRKRGDIY